MVEIRFGGNFEVADLAGCSVSEARDQFKADFEIPGKAVAKINGKKIKGDMESETILNDDDTLSFGVARARTPFLVGALLLALDVAGPIEDQGHRLGRAVPRGPNGDYSRAINIEYDEG